MLDFIPISILYALPLIPIFIFGRAIKMKYAKTIEHYNTKETTVTADQIARKILDQNGLATIPVEKSEDFSMNAFDAEQSTVFLSPDTVGQKDLTSVGLALSAVGPLIFEKVNPSKSKLRKMTGIWQPVSFWLVFTVLAFGLMASSIPMIVLGYALSLTTLLLHRCNIKLDEEAYTLALSQGQNCGLFRENDIPALKQVTQAIARHN